MGSNIIVTTREELEELIHKALSNVLAANSNSHVAPHREFLTPAELAERLGVSVRSVKTMVSRDGLPAHLVGPRMYRYLWSEVQAWLAARGRNTGALPRTPLRAAPPPSAAPPSPAPSAEPSAGSRRGKRFTRDDL